MSLQTKRQLRNRINELETENSKLLAKIDIYELAINNAGLSVLKEKKPKEKEEFGFVCKKKSK